MNLTQEMSGDITVHAAGSSFSLHKFPLVSRCGYIRKLVSESSDPNLSEIKLPDIPGGERAFDLATKFCYGVNFEINSGNIAMLRCVAEYLQMTEEFAVNNLVGRAEAYLNEVSLKNLKAAISVLHSSQDFPPIAEEVKLVSHCIDAIAYLACKDICRRVDCVDSSSDILPLTSNVHWWAEDLIVLRIDLFQRVLIALLARGFEHSAFGPILTLYADKSLQELDQFGMGRKKIESKQEHGKRVVVETITSLLPKEKNAVPVSFLSFLLRAAVHLDTTISCRLDLEKRMACQLGQAVLNDILFPSFSISGETLFDVETVKRVMMNFLEYEGKSLGHYVEENLVSTPLSEMEKVGRLMESYLAEIASDRNLSMSKFIEVAEIIPEQSRVTEDGMYRAIDIYLKAHPALNDEEKRELCGIMNCQKLSPEASAHAAQNNRLSVQATLQVLYHEQQRLRVTINSSFTNSQSQALPPRPDSIIQSIDEFSRLKKENESLNMELMKMKARMKKMEKHGDKSDIGSPSDSSLSSSSGINKIAFSRRKSFMYTVSKKLGQLYPFPRNDKKGIFVSLNKPRGESVSEIKQMKNRRYSIS